ncbi:MAG: hypothetical protein AAFZ63_26995, partial [Bacteroidota bacterium]
MNKRHVWNTALKLQNTALMGRGDFDVFNLLTIFSCGQDDDIDVVEPEVSYLFEDGFESVNNDLNDLFPLDGSRWTNIQLVDPDNGENTIELNTTTVNEQDYALKIIAKPSDDILSKADIEKGGFSAPVGANISIQAKFFIETSEDLQDLLLIDLEYCSCWDPTVPDNQCPGIRLMMKEENYLSIERGKILGSTIAQTEVAFPIGEWVDLEWQMKLSPDDSGENVLTINGQEVINALAKNMPNADEFRAEAAMNGISFELQEPLAYERIQIGATANPTPHEVVMYVDDFRVEIE